MSVKSVRPEFWVGKKVFLTGHTGFKGGWLSLWLSSMGARVTGYSIPPNTDPNLFDILSLDKIIYRSIIADIRDFSRLESELKIAAPDIVIHMAAQPLVRYSYSNPIETYATNVMGTVNLLEATKSADSVRATIVVTTDKCYENKEWIWGYREGDPMGGADPYSSSKGCAELITSAYRQSFFSENSSINNQNCVASARAGNVIGGGDWSEDRLIPDAIRAFNAGIPLTLRNPSAVRPWQHVLEPLSGYLVLVQALYEGGSEFASAWNFGPLDTDARSVGQVVDILKSKWTTSASWVSLCGDKLHEANLLKLDCTKAAVKLGWTPKWSLETAIEKIIDWEKAYVAKRDMADFMLNQIQQHSIS